jgi:hypothetical protein
MLTLYFYLEPFGVADNSGYGLKVQKRAERRADAIING